MGDLSVEDIKKILRKVDEFNSLDTGDTIVHSTIGSHRICRVRFTLRQLDLISFMSENELINLDRNAYITGSWAKVPKEYSPTSR